MKNLKKKKTNFPIKKKTPREKAHNLNRQFLFPLKIPKYILVSRQQFF